MSTPKGSNAITGNPRGGVIATTYRLLMEEENLQPQTYGELVQSHGNGLRMFDAWMWAKRSIDISTRDMQVIEEGHFWDTIDVSEQIATTSAGDDLVVKSAKGIGRKGFVVHVPAKYLTGAEIAQSYRIKTKTYANGTYTYTCEAILGTETVGTAIPVGQKLIVGGSMYAAGSQQPAGMVQDYFLHNHKTRIIKETIDMEGGQGALKEWPEFSQSVNGGGGIYARALITAQLKLRHQLNDAVLMGYPNSAGLTEDNRWGEANAILGDYGLIPSMYTKSMKQYYTGAYTMDNFDVLKFLFASQGITGQSGLFMQGQELGLSIENSKLGFIQQYSGGTNLYDGLKGIGFNIKEVNKNNFKTYLCEIPEFSNPVTYAADGFNFEPMGMIFPDSKVTATLNMFEPNGAANSSLKKALNHMVLGYLNYGGENRKLIVGNKAGVNGYGIPFSDDWDDRSTYMLSEFMVILLALNQTILVLRTH